MTVRFVRRPSHSAAATSVLVACALLAAVATTAAQKNKAPTPVTVTIRCTTTADCLFAGSQDTLTDDGLGAYPANARWESDEGTYINSNGGVVIQLLTGVKEDPVDRRATLTFPPDGNTSAAVCNRTFTTVSPTHFTFVGNVSNGIEAMVVGASQDGSGGITFENPTADGYVAWRINFPTGTLTVTRTAANVWAFESPGAAVELQCTTAKGRTVTASDGFYSIPFKFTVVK
jgi:hypothetical protein